jgi:hypothetical protein
VEAPLRTPVALARGVFSIDTYQQIAPLYADVHKSTTRPPFWRQRLQRFADALRSSPAYQANPAFPVLDKLLLDKAGPNGIAILAGMKGNLLPRLGITTHEYYLSDRLSEAHSLQLA